MSEDKKHPKSKPREDDSFGFEEDDHFDDEHLFEDSEFEAEGWSIPHDPESVTKLLKSLEGLVPGILRRVGVESGASEGARGAGSRGAGQEAGGSEKPSPGSDGFRARLGGTKLPREVVNFILSQVDTTKREFLRIASSEVRVFLERVDLGGEVAKILTTLSFEVRMEVRFIPNDQALKPSARGRMRVKRNRSAEEKASDAAEDDEEVGDERSEAGVDGEGEEMPGREFSDVFKPRRWSLRRRARGDGESQDLDAASEVEDETDDEDE